MVYLYDIFQISHSNNFIISHGSKYKFCVIFPVKQDNEAKRAATRLENPSNLLDTSTVGDTSSSNGANTNNPKTRAENIHERIGFNPLPRNT